MWKASYRLSESQSLSVHKGSLHPVIFQGIEAQAPEPQRGHINMLLLTYTINSSAINSLLHAVTHTHSEETVCWQDGWMCGVTYGQFKCCH